jgi:hypothetical protein
MELFSMNLSRGRSLTLTYLLLSVLFAGAAQAYVPTREQDCEYSRWSQCSPSAKGQAFNGPCPEGTVTLKPYEPDKDCSPAALAIAAAVPTPPKVSPYPTPPIHINQAPSPWISRVSLLLFTLSLLIPLILFLRRNKGSASKNTVALIFRWIFCAAVSLMCAAVAALTVYRFAVVWILRFPIPQRIHTMQAESIYQILVGALLAFLVAGLVMLIAMPIFLSVTARIFNSKMP